MILILIALVAFVLFLSLGSAWTITHPPKITSTQTPKDFGWEFEKVILTTEDGLELKGWLVPSATGSIEQTVILLHGYPADKGNLLGWAEFLHDEFGLLFFDFRYFGESEGSFTSLGDRERLDVLSAIAFLKSRDVRSIGLMGFSFGGAVALLTLEKTADVDAVVTDSAFANLDLIGKVYWGDIPFLGFFERPLTALTKFFARLMLQVHPEEVIPEKKVRGTTLPMLLIHSREDALITVEHAERLKEALQDNPQAEIWIIEKGIHGALPQNIKDSYEQKVLIFFRKHLEDV